VRQNIAATTAQAAQKTIKVLQLSVIFSEKHKQIIKSRQSTEKIYIQIKARM